MRALPLLALAVVASIGCEAPPPGAPVPPDSTLDASARPDAVRAPDAGEPTTRADAPETLDVPRALDRPETLDAPEVDASRSNDLGATDVPPPFDPSADHAELTAGVRAINLGSALASALVVHGPSAFPVVFDGGGACFVAAARAGAGRVLSYGHESLANDPANATDDRGVLLGNALRWMTRGRAGAVVGYEGSRNALRDFARAQGFVARPATAAQLGEVQVWVAEAGAARSPDEVAAIVAWVRGGGGLIVTGHAWYWGYSHANAYRDFAGNQVLNPLGITITTDNNPRNNAAVPVIAPSDLEHALRALERVRAHVVGSASLDMAQQVRASATVRRAIRAMPVDSTYLVAARALRATLPDVIPTEQRPVRPATMPLPALTVVIDMKLAAELPAGELRAHPASAEFPGAVPSDAPRGEFTRPVLARYAGRTNRLGGSNERPVWRSLGLYAPAGERVTVTVPSSAADGRLDVLIGAHWDDNTSTDAWTRFPSITRIFPLTTPSTEVASAFGGLLYVRVPAGVDLGSIDVRVRGAVEAPRYVHGVTDPAAWRSRLRALGAPWAELETPKLTLTLPAAVARGVDDPSALMSFWDRVMDADADLAATPRDRPRAERIVFDRQIVAGFMHAGYPIEAFVPQAAEAVDLATLRREGAWGFFHELGHNHQFSDWSWSGTGEATVNLWSVYVMEQVVGLAPRSGHPAITPTQRQARVTTYVSAGRRFAQDWSVWVGLETFLQLQEGFGWQLLRDLNREYMDLPEGQRPSGEAARIQRWIQRSSARANRDLVPFYQAWGFPISDETRAATASLPAWAENPMR